MNSRTILTFQRKTKSNKRKFIDPKHKNFLLDDQFMRRFNFTEFYAYKFFNDTVDNFLGKYKAKNLYRNILTHQFKLKVAKVVKNHLN